LNGVVRFTIKKEILDALETHAYDGELYVSFETARLKNPDNFGRTHTLYQSTRIANPNVEEPAPRAKATRQRQTKKQVAEAK
jgi:hypothetical protein